MSEGNDYAKIPVCAVRPLVGENLADFSLFLSGKDGADPVLYRQAGSDVSLPDLERLREIGVASLCVRSDDLARCEGILESKLAELVSRGDVSADEKAGLVFHVGTLVAKELAGAATAPAELDRANNVVQNIITAVLSDAKVASQLLRVSEHEATTASHMFAVSAFAVILGARVIGGDREHLRQLGLAGMMHDAGKLGIDKAILGKREPLCGEEARLIQRHPIESVRLLGNDPAATPMVRRAILQHHERLDGQGYPIGLAGPDLILESRILAVVDSFHALIGRRSYRDPLQPGQANEILLRQSGRQFDSDVLRAWVDLFADYHTTTPTPLVEAHSRGDGQVHSDHNPMRAADRAIANRQQRHRCRNKLTLSYAYVGRLGHCEPTGPLQQAAVEDLSRSGAGIVVTHPLYRGEILNIEIPAATDESVWVRGAVAWCRRNASGSFRVGVRFLNRIPPGVIHKDVPLVSCFDLSEVIVVSDSVSDDKPVSTSEPNTTDDPKGAHEPATPPQRNPSASASAEPQHPLAALERAMKSREISSQDAKAVIELSRMSDPDLRRMSVEAVARIHTPTGRSALMALLRDPDDSVRLQATSIVVAKRLEDLNFALKPQLDDPVPQIALQAAAALAGSGDLEALKVIVRALDGERDEARQAASLLGRAVGQRFPANSEGIKAARGYVKARGLIPVAP